jgi:hypothetical protein
MLVGSAFCDLIQETLLPFRGAINGSLSFSDNSQTSMLFPSTPLPGVAAHWFSSSTRPEDFFFLRLSISRIAGRLTSLSTILASVCL